MVRPLEERTRLLTVLLWVSLAVSALWVLSLPAVYWDLSKLPADMSADKVETPITLAAGLIAMPMLPLGLLVVIVFLMWVHRATANLRMFTSQEMRFTPGWSVGWYFVPIMSFIRPYQGMHDIWRASHSGDMRRSWLVRLWWGMFLLSVVMASLASASIPDGETVGDYRRLLLAESPAYVLDVALYAVTLAMVIEIGRAYRANVEEWTLEHPAIPAGWYRDPSSPEMERFWDGATWGDAVRPMDPRTVDDAGPRPDSSESG